MDDKQTRMFLATVAVLFVLWLAYKRALLANSTQPVADASAAPNLSLPDSSPIVVNTPGMVSEPWYMNGSNHSIATPESIQATITVNPWNAINQDYMPLFGFVGMAQ